MTAVLVFPRCQLGQALSGCRFTSKHERLLVSTRRGGPLLRDVHHQAAALPLLPQQGVEPLQLRWTCVHL